MQSCQPRLQQLRKITPSQKNVSAIHINAPNDGRPVDFDIITHAISDHNKSRI